MSDSPARRRVLLLNNYPFTGIGDLGLELREELAREGTDCRYEETRPNGGGERAQLRAVVGWPGTVIANVGLTAWGSSGARNLVGFLALGLRTRLGRSTIALVHNPIEVIDPKTAGYRVSRWTRRGAHFATARLRGSRVVVFSPTVEDLLVRSYAIRPDLVAPIPCRPWVGDRPPIDTPPVVVVLGYMSAYKGYDLLPGVSAALSQPARLVAVGGPHRVLMEDADYRRAHAELVDQLHSAGVETPGRIPDAELDGLLARSTVGLMPYSSTQGGSSTFSRFASAGVPVVAPRLPLFEWLESLGAGLVMVPPTTAGFAEGTRRILSDATLRTELAARQLDFAGRHSWPEFVQALGRLG